MYTRLAALTAAGVLLATSAFAVTDPNRPTRTTDECMQLITVTEQTVQEQNDVGEKAQAEVDKLLAALKDQCSNQQFEDADRTAELIRGLIATE